MGLEAQLKWPNDLLVGGDLVLSNGASMSVYAGPTNGSECGALVSVTGSMRVAS